MSKWSGCVIDLLSFLRIIFELLPVGTGRAIMATFFDLFEDGKLDVLAVEGSDGSGYKLSAYTNTTQDSDAYFIKVGTGTLPFCESCQHI